VIIFYTCCAYIDFQTKESLDCSWEGVDFYSTDFVT